MDARQLLNSLLDEIDEDEKALAEKRAVVAFLRRRLSFGEPAAGLTPGQNDSLKQAAPPPRRRLIIRKKSDTSGSPVLTAEPSRTNGDGPTSFLEHVATAVNEMGDREFTVSEIHDELIAQGVPMASITPRASISTALSRLIEKTGTLMISFKGSGNIPNKYRRVQEGAAASPDDAGDGVKEGVRNEGAP